MLSSNPSLIAPKIYYAEIKFHGAKKPHHHVRDYFSALTLKGIDRDIVHTIFL